MNKFTITAYNKAEDVATVTFVLGEKGSYPGGTVTGVKISGIPKDTKGDVKDFMRKYMKAYVNGKVEEMDKQVDISNEVKTLLNVTTEV